jgi:hypothetical protein
LLAVFFGTYSAAPASPQPAVSALDLSSCRDFAFSTEQHFLTQGPEPADGNPIISDGDLLGLVVHNDQLTCTVCARSTDLIEQFDVVHDLGLDAVDILPTNPLSAAFSTSLNSPHGGQFTAGDLLFNSGMVIPNRTLTSAFKSSAINYDLGLDAVHFIGADQNIVAFINEVQNIEDWSSEPLVLSYWLGVFEVDIWYSTEGTPHADGKPIFLDGDLLSARDGVIIADNAALHHNNVPAGIPQAGVDFGLDLVAADRISDTVSIHHSAEIPYQPEPAFAAGDLLLYGDTVQLTNKAVFNCFEPKAGDIGLDALYMARPLNLERLPLFLPYISHSER